MKKDRVFVYAIAISVLAHLVAIGIIGRNSGSNLATAAVPQAPRTINVDLIANPDDALKPPAPVQPARPVPQPVQTPTYTPAPNRIPQLNTPAYTAPTPSNPVPNIITPSIRPTTTSQPPGNPGGKINIGSTSAQGDIPGNWSGGHTPSGYVPGGDNGVGTGSGSKPGTGTPEPPKNVAEGPNTRPAPAPVVPKPTPRMLSVKVCDESGLLPGPNCKRTHASSFLEGVEPTRTCNQCKAPVPEPVHVNRVADRANPELSRDTRISVPNSVDEGQSLTIEVEYTVTADGDVSNVQVTRSSGIRALDRAIVSAASGLKYKPAVQNGIPRGVKMTRTYKINT